MAVPGYTELGSGSPPFNPEGSVFGPWLQGQLNVAAARPAETLADNSRLAVTADLGLTFILGSHILAIDQMANLEDGWFFYAKGPGTIAAAGSEQIEGAASLVLDTGESAQIVFDGTALHALRGGGAAIDPAALKGTSNSTVAVEQGTKNFTTQTGKAWSMGQRLRAASDDGTYVVEGPVTSYNSGTGALVIEADFSRGSVGSPVATHADWNISVTGEMSSIPTAAANATLVDAATIAVDMSAGFNFGGGPDTPLTLTDNRALGAPTNVVGGLAGIVWFAATGSTRTLTVNAAYKINEGIEVGPYAIPTTKRLGLAYVTLGTTVILTGIIWYTP